MMVCQKCGKPIANKERLGSLTGFLFGAGNCSCARGKTNPSVGLDSDDSSFCPKCGLKVETEERAGSLTGFLFQSTRCKCTPDEDFVEGRMSSKFWKLKKAGSGTVTAAAPKIIGRRNTADRGLCGGYKIFSKSACFRIYGSGNQLWQQIRSNAKRLEAEAANFASQTGSATGNAQITNT